MAAYIEQLPMAPVNGVGPGNDLVYGEAIYKKECDNCHGAQGEGDLKDHIPAIQGQHYHYLVRQFEWIRHGKRRNADPKMVKQIQRFTARDVMAVMDYASRIKPPAEKVATPVGRIPTTLSMPVTPCHTLRISSGRLLHNGRFLHNALCGATDSELPDSHGSSWESRPSLKTTVAALRSFGERGRDPRIAIF